jgi:hypothetical protein
MARVIEKDGPEDADAATVLLLLLLLLLLDDITVPSDAATLAVVEVDNDGFATALSAAEVTIPGMTSSLLFDDDVVVV